jgi:hypothetical protein
MQKAGDSTHEVELSFSTATWCCCCCCIEFKMSFCLLGPASNNLPHPCSRCRLARSHGLLCCSHRTALRLALLTVLSFIWAAVLTHRTVLKLDFLTVLSLLWGAVPTHRTALRLALLVVSYNDDTVRRASLKIVLWVGTAAHRNDIIWRSQHYHMSK